MCAESATLRRSRMGVAGSAGGSQGGEHLLGYPLHGRYLVWPVDEEVESGEAEAEEVSQLADRLPG